MTQQLDIGEIFANIFDNFEPIIVDLANSLGFPWNILLGFLFGGIDFTLSETLF